MLNHIKYGFSRLINEIMLRPFGLKLSHRIGRDAVTDMQRLLSKVEVKYIIDGGAYQGDFSLQMLTAFPSANIYAFEPQASSWELLVQTASRNPHVKPFRYALGDDSEPVTMHINNSSLTSSLLPSSKEALKYFKEYNQLCNTELVQVIRLKDFLAQESIPYIDLLKLDVQGYELQALRGLDDSIDSLKLIYAEVWFHNIYVNGCLCWDINDYLLDHLFTFYQFYNLVTSPLDGRLLFGDAVFLNSRFA